MRKAENCKVLIIGAGVSGLAAAASLNRGGIHDVIILEARDRIGGRISTVTIDGATIDEGATWIHGKQGNPLFSIVEEEKIKVTDWDYLAKRRAADWLTDGGNLTNDDVTMLSEACKVHCKIMENIFSYTDDVTNKGHLIKQPRDLMTLLAAGWYDRIMAEVPLERRHLLKALLRTLVLAECADAGVDQLIDCPTSSFDEYVYFKGSDVILKGGYNKILNYFMKSIPTSSTRCNCDVTKINWGDQSAGELVEVTYKTRETDNNIVRADHVIVTVPLGCLKRDHVTMFDPPLPIRKVKAIENIGFGKITKIALIYDKPFWNTDKEMIELLWKPTTKTSHWSQDIVEFIIRKSRNSFWLETWIPGNKAIEIEKSDPTEIGRIITNMFRRFIERRDIPLPKHVHVSKFVTSKYTNGSYSYISHTSTGQDLEILGEPLPRDGATESSKLQLLFAGEATSRHYFGTVHGAMLTGNREAKRILTHYSRTATSSSV